MRIGKNIVAKTLSRHLRFGFINLTRGALVLLVMVLGSLDAKESQAQFTVTGGTEVVSQYLWRGYALVDGATVQPSLNVDWEGTGLTLSLWGSASLSQRDQYQGVDEFDLTLNYAVSSGSWGNFDAGLIFYTFPGQGSFTLAEQTSPEFYVNVAPSLPLSPEVFLAYDVNLGGGLYAAFSAGRSVSVAGQPIDFGVTAGYNHGQFEADSGMSHVDVSVSTDLALGAASLSPRAVYVRSFENTSNTGNRVFFGVGLGL